MNLQACVKKGFDRSLCAMCACSAIGIDNGTAEAGALSLRDGTTGRVALPQAQPSMSADRVWTGHHSALWVRLAEALVRGSGSSAPIPQNEKIKNG